MFAMAEFKLFNYVINTGFETAHSCIQCVLSTKRWINNNSPVRNKILGQT